MKTHRRYYNHLTNTSTHRHLDIPWSQQIRKKSFLFSDNPHYYYNLYHYWSSIFSRRIQNNLSAIISIETILLKYKTGSHKWTYIRFKKLQEFKLIHPFEYQVKKKRLNFLPYFSKIYQSQLLKKQRKKIKEQFFNLITQLNKNKS